MIVIQHQSERITANVYGEFTLADFKEFEATVNEKKTTEEFLDLFFDLRKMDGFTLDMALQDINFTKQHAKDFRKIAVITDSQWVAWSSWLAQLFMDAQIQAFEDEEPALVWLDSDIKDTQN